LPFLTKFDGILDQVNNNLLAPHFVDLNYDILPVLGNYEIDANVMGLSVELNHFDSGLDELAHGVLL